jgi:ACS family glucarate transporter-like MFS transporter
MKIILPYKYQLPYRYRVLLLLFTLTLITFIDRNCISLVGVRIKNEFNLTNSEFGWVLGAFALAYALFEIPAGVLGDRIGQRKVLIRIVLWWSVFTALTGLTTGFTSLVLVRFLFGAGEAGALPNGTGVIAKWFPKNEISKGATSLIVGTSVGAGIAPLIVVPISAAYGWRAPFFVIAVAGAAWALICTIWFRNNPGEMRRISSEEKEFIEKNGRHSADDTLISWKTFLVQRKVLRMMLGYFCSQCALYFFIAWLPIYLQQGRHFTEGQMKSITSILFFFGIAGGLCSGFVNDWMVRKKGLTSSRRILTSVPYAIMAFLFFISATVQSNTVAAIALVCCYPWMPFAGVTVFSTCIDVGQNNSSTLAGIVNFSGQIGSFFFAVLFGKLVDSTHSYNAPLLLIAGLLVVAAMLWSRVQPSPSIACKLPTR